MLLQEGYILTLVPICHPVLPKDGTAMLPGSPQSTPHQPSRMQRVCGVTVEPGGDSFQHRLSKTTWEEFEVKNKEKTKT